MDHMEPEVPGGLRGSSNRQHTDAKLIFKNGSKYDQVQFNIGKVLDGEMGEGFSIEISHFPH